VRRTLAGDLTALWETYKDAVVPVSNAAILVALVALLGLLGNLYLFR
jgi:hypothetical protein